MGFSFGVPQKLRQKNSTWIQVALLVVIALMVWQDIQQRKQFRISQEATLREVGLQLAINNSLVSDDTMRIRIAEYLSKHSHGKLTPSQCVDVSRAIMDAHKLQSIPPTLSLAVMARESDYDPTALSSKGAIGLLQVLPGTARPYLRELGWTGESVEEALRDPYTNTRVGLSFLSDLLKSFKDQDILLPITAYNYGEGGVRAYMAKQRLDVSMGYAQAILKTQQDIRERHLQ